LASGIKSASIGRLTNRSSTPDFACSFVSYRTDDPPAQNDD
jgi:hypothetical protein